jgi:regulator of sirC expression with transglutaminase-like and TPR domain
MSDELSLTLFAHLCAAPERNFAEAALLLAEIERPGLDTGRYLGILDDLGEGIRQAVRPGPDPEQNEALLAPAARWLHGEAGFHGNEGDYYDPRNSLLDQVLDRRTGIPITLAFVLVEACRRAGIHAHGVSFPAHFLVRSAPQGKLVIDPFTGRLLSRDDVRSFYARATGDARDPPDRLLGPATSVQILLRMLANLRGIYASRNDTEHMLAVLERMNVLAPSEDLAREIARLGGGKKPWGPAARGGAGSN